MRKEELIKKWLADELTADEMQAFKALDEYASYVKISENAKAFKAPEFNIESSLQDIEAKIQPNKTPVLRYIASIAAVLILGFFLFKNIYFNSELTSIQTDIALTESINLPDNSVVNLNSNSILTYNSADWAHNRQLDLQGEALFNVEKGKKFSVSTPQGNVQVLGTVFNVKSREYLFEVSCFEGSVQVEVNNETYILKQNDFLSFFDGKVSLRQNTLDAPTWQKNMTILKNQPLDVVIKELKNYYDFEFDTSTIDTSKRFTGSFGHVNIKLALNSITLPLGLTYKIDGKTIILGD
jgi:ferric-dicitrate binding protein FerR (iron transport regulator)